MDYAIEDEHMRNCPHSQLMLMDAPKIGQPIWMCVDCGAVVAREIFVASQTASTDYYIVNA